MPEWSNGLVLKTSVPKGTEGSNPSLSANAKTQSMSLGFVVFCAREGVRKAFVTDCKRSAAICPKGRLKL